jgi:hypothetical protein
MFDIRQKGAARNAVAAQTVGDKALRFVVQPFQQAPEEALGGRAIPFLLHQDVQHDPVLIHGATGNAARL